MADKGYTKMKLLYIKDFLEKNSDEDHPVSVEDISDMLLSKDIECERKSIYSDVKTLKESGMDAEMILQVHDELLIETRRDCAQRVQQLLVDCMENAVNLAIPLSVDAHIGDTWYDAK
jgi:hypothetical protein